MKIIVALGVGWILLTLWVQQPRTVPPQEFTSENVEGRVLILFNPDPFYDLDQQLANAFATGMHQEGFQVHIRGYLQFQPDDLLDRDMLVIISNTYNWAPDRPTRRFLKRAKGLEGLPVVGITLGSGATGRSHRRLREMLTASGATILESAEYWLMRPNDESQQHRSNTYVAREAARELGVLVARKLAGNTDKT